MDPAKALFFKNRSEWRDWLENNHSEEKEAWLVHYKKSSGKTHLSHSDGVEEAICFGWIDGILKKVDEEKYVLRYSPRKAGSVWSKINKEKAERMIEAGKMSPSGISAVKEAKKRCLWDSAYTNKKRDKIPQELKQAFLKEPTAWKYFNSFANTYRNMYVGWVTGAKTEETKRKRIKEIVARSAAKRKPAWVERDIGKSD